MHPAIVYNINGPSHGSGHRRNKDGATIPAVLLDDEGGNQRLFHLHQGRLETGRFSMIGESRSQTAKHRVTGNPFEYEPLRSAFCLSANGGLNGSPDKETQPYEHQDPNDARMRDAMR
jgi:hypothetical protein